MAIWCGRHDEPGSELCGGEEYIPKAPGKWLSYFENQLDEADVVVTPAEIYERDDFLRLGSHIFDAAAAIGVCGVVIEAGDIDSVTFSERRTTLNLDECPGAIVSTFLPATGDLYRRFEYEWCPTALVFGRGPSRDLCSRVAWGGEHLDHESIMFVVAWGPDLDVVLVWVREKDVDAVAGVMATAWRELAKRVPQPPDQSA